MNLIMAAGAQSDDVAHNIAVPPDQPVDVRSQLVVAANLASRLASYQSCSSFPGKGFMGIRVSRGSGSSVVIGAKPPGSVPFPTAWNRARPLRKVRTPFQMASPTTYGAVASISSGNPTFHAAIVSLTSHFATVARRACQAPLGSAPHILWAIQTRMRGGPVVHPAISTPFHTRETDRVSAISGGLESLLRHKGHLHYHYTTPRALLECE